MASSIQHKRNEILTEYFKCYTDLKRFPQRLTQKGREDTRHIVTYICDKYSISESAFRRMLPSNQLNLSENQYRL